MPRPRAATGSTPAHNTLRPFANNIRTFDESEEGGNTSQDEGASLGGLRRFGALEDLLSTRPAKEDLMERNILPQHDEGISGALLAKQKELKKQLIQDSLKSHLTARPAAENLVEHNILKSTTVDPSLQAKQEELRLSQVQSSLSRKLSARMTEKELLDSKILQAPVTQTE